MEKKNPWLTIWTKPRETIGSIVQQNPDRSIWWLAFIYGFSVLLSFIQSYALGSVAGLIVILLASVVLGTLYGYLNFTIWSWFVFKVGKWFKGGGNFKEVRSAYSWSCVPLVFNIPIWFLLLALYGHGLFLQFPDPQMLSSKEMLLFFLLSILKIILSVWSLVIYFNALAEVQKFSVLKAVLNVVVTGLLLAVLFYLAWTLLAYAIGGVSAFIPLLSKPI